MEYNLTGCWNSKGCSSEEGCASNVLFDDLYGHRNIVGAGTILTIKQESREKEEIFFTYKTSLGECIRLISIEELNFVLSTHGPVFGTAIDMNESFDKCSILLIGPSPGLRIKESYSLSSDGQELSVSYMITTHEAGTLSVERIYHRSNIVHAIPLVPIYFVGWRSACNWKDEACHNSAALRNVSLSLEVDEGDNCSRLSNLSNEYCGGTVVMYCVQVGIISFQVFVFVITNPHCLWQVSMVCGDGIGRQWLVFYRFRQFHALKSFIFRELVNNPARAHGGPHSVLPPFPRRALSSLSRQAIQERCDGLQQFLRAVVAQGGFDCPNIIDVVSTFLQVLHLPH